MTGMEFPVTLLFNMYGEIMDIEQRPEVGTAQASSPDPRAMIPVPGEDGATYPLSFRAPRSVPEVLDHLERYQEILDATPPRYQDDGVASFNYLYTVITRDVLDKLDEGTYFEDNDYLASLDVVFAIRYFSAMGLCPGPDHVCPTSWAVLVRHRDNPAISPLQFAVAGVNAHINFDLAMAVVTTAEDLGRRLGAGSQRADFQRINAIFADHMHRLREHFEGRFLREEDRAALAAMADLIDDVLVVGARDVAWHHAEHLWRLRNDPAETAHWLHGLDVLVGLAGRAILSHLPHEGGRSR